MQPVKRDPAPSRLAYRMQRLWLTPGVKRAARVGPPVALVAGALVYAATDAGMRETITAQVASWRESIENREELMVERIRVAGATPGLVRAVELKAALSLPVSSLTLDVKAVRARIEELAPVKTASVRIAQGGVLEVDVVERLPAVLWRAEDSLEVLDAEGVVLGRAAKRVDHPHLPLILGAGAGEAVAEVLRLHAVAQPIAERIRGWQRVGQRRWNVVLDNGQEILLPEREPDAAILRVIGIDAADDLFRRDVSLIDMRNPARPVLRLGALGLNELNRIRRIERGEDG